jgi:hypothetical protein
MMANQVGDNRELEVGPHHGGLVRGRNSGTETQNGAGGRAGARARGTEGDSEENLLVKDRERRAEDCEPWWMAILLEEDLRLFFFLFLPMQRFKARLVLFTV